MKKYSLLLLLLLIPYYTFAVTVAEHLNLVFTLNDDGTCSVVDYKDNLPAELTIPSEVNIDGKTYNVTTIDEAAFEWCNSLTSVEIPNSVTSILSSAFAHCESLGSVVIPASVTSIGEYAFGWCSNLKALIFRNATPPNANEFIVKESTSNGFKVYVPEGSQIRGVWEYDRTDLSSPGIFPGDLYVKTYEHYEGDYPDLLFEPITDKEGECSVKANPDNKPQGAVTIPSTILKKDGNIYNVTKIGYQAFFRSSLTSVFIPSSVTVIDEMAFSQCASLTSVTIPNSVERIERYAFISTSLTSVVIPSSVSYLGFQVFSGCTQLKAIIFKGEICPQVEAPGRDVMESCVFYIPEGGDGSYIKRFKEMTTTIIYVNAADCEELIFSPITGKEGECSVKKANNDIKGDNGKLVIPSAILKDDDNIYNVTTVEADAFELCSSLTSVEIPSSVTSIGEYAFADCTQLKSLIFMGEACPTLGENILYSVENCTVYVPEASIDDYKLKLVDVDASRIKGYVEESACEELVFEPITGKDGECSVKANPDNNPQGEVTIPSTILKDGKIYNVTSIRTNAFSKCSSLTSVEIPNSVTSIGQFAFAQCTSLTSVGIPSSVASIGDGAFIYCEALTSVEIPSSVTKIGASTFDRCSSLTSVEIPNSVTEIGEYAFYYCEVLTSVEIPNSVKSIGALAFRSCSSLTSVNIPSSVTEIGAKTFSACSSLTSVEIPNSVKSIGEYAFDGCSSLTSVEIPDSVKSIGAFAFWGCSSLTSINIPERVTSIGESAFARCSLLKSLIFMGEACSTLGEDILYSVENCTVYVPNKTLVEHFKGNFKNNKVKLLFDITSGVPEYIKTGDSFKIELSAYPEGYAPEGLSYSVKEEGVTLTEGEDAFTLTGHGAATVRVADAGNENIYAETTLNVYVSGDSNNDGSVDITDAVTTANYIVENNPKPFLKIAANVVDPDVDKISIADVVATVDIALDAPATEPSEAPKALHAPANTADYLTFRVGTEGIALSLAGEGVFSALQADVTLPAGAVLNDVVAGDRLTGNHSVMYRMVDDRTVRVAVFALSLDTFVPGDAVVILDVDGMGDGDVTAANVIASDADGHGYRLGVDGGGMTGIEGVVPGEGAVVRASGDGITVDGAQGMDVEVYGMDGRLVRRIAAGDDRVTVDVAPGVYVVRVGAAPAVKIAVR